MTSKNKIKFRSIEELEDPSIVEKLSQKEFAEELPIEDFLSDKNSLLKTKTSRRDFLKFMGFTTATVALAACEAPITKSIPYVVKPEGLIPGVPNYYASTFYDGYDLASVLVKTREGRPIKIDSNDQASRLSSTNARVQASVLSLYDNNRIKHPKLKGKKANWRDIDNYVLEGLIYSQMNNKKIVIMSPSFPSPSFEKLVDNFKNTFSNCSLVIYDSIPNADLLEAFEVVYGRYALPVYDLSEVELVVSFSCDFLNDSAASSYLATTYSKARIPKNKMLKHIQIESNFSFTGANSDERIPLKPSEIYCLLAQVYDYLDGKDTTDLARRIAEQLMKNPSKSVVLVEGDRNAHVIGLLINEKLKSKALDRSKISYTRQFNRTKFNEFVSSLKDDEIGMLINFNTNPMYSYFGAGSDLSSAIKSIKYSFSLSDYEDETSTLFQSIAPATHWLESWFDLKPQNGVYFFAQPTIQKINDSRQFQECLIIWMALFYKIKSEHATLDKTELDKLVLSQESYDTIISENRYSSYSFLKTFWSTTQSNIKKSFNELIYSGFCEDSTDIISLQAKTFNPTDYLIQLLSSHSAGFELNLYTKIGMGDGSQSNNPWLQELPDPISRNSWDNYLTISPYDAKENRLYNKVNGRMQLDGSIVNLTVGDLRVDNVPVFIQPGQAKGTLGLALGYGRSIKGKINKIGVNAFDLYKNQTPIQFNARIQPVKGNHKFASMQMQSTLVGRYEIAREIDLDTFLNVDSEHWNEKEKMHTYSGELPIDKIDLWRSFDSSDGPHFNLSIDLNSCTGCGACVIACQAENNIPVVGKEEIRNSRDMYWLRIDRYYSAKKKVKQKEEILKSLDQIPMYKELIEPDADNPDVIFQPVMCQHCNHAPCESVCPVAATSHGKQGQNQMAYNRCVGTRYCANNCPYKVRRFNWFNYALNDDFDYNMNNDLGRMVLNPDVAVRTRGVMEKCSLCIQMTQSTILEAKKQGRKLKDDEVQTACSKACSSNSIIFGDINDMNSEISKLSRDKRKYTLLEEVGTKPNVFYQYKVRNRKESQ